MWYFMIHHKKPLLMASGLARYADRTGAGLQPCPKIVHFNGTEVPAPWGLLSLGAWTSVQQNAQAYLRSRDLSPVRQD